MCAQSLSHMKLFATPLTAACQAPLFMGFSRQEYWSGFHFLLQGIFLTQGSNSRLPHCRQTLYHLSHQGALVWTSVVGVSVQIRKGLVRTGIQGGCCI